jgi:hypothetical protein
MNNYMQSQTGSANETHVLNIPSDCTVDDIWERCVVIKISGNGKLWYQQMVASHMVVSHRHTQF